MNTGACPAMAAPAEILPRAAIAERVAETEAPTEKRNRGNEEAEADAKKGAEFPPLPQGG